MQTVWGMKALTSLTSTLICSRQLIIIDTLQKVREVGGDNYSYANDYQIMARLKSFADAHGLCILLVHHTRKQTADDKFDMISGTSGLLGAADGAFLLQKEKRTGNAATLEVSGRDQQDQKLYLIRNTETLLWELQRAETELWKEPPEPLLDEIDELVMKDKSFWEGSATELVSLIKVEIQPHVITRKLNVLSGRLYAEYGILPKQQSDFIRHFNDHIRCIKRVIVPQIDFFHGYFLQFQFV